VLVLFCEKCGELQGLDLIQNMSEEERDIFNRGNGCSSCRNRTKDSYAKQADNAAVAIFIQRAMRGIYKDDLQGLAEEIKYLELV